MTVHDLTTPALLVDGATLDANLRTMATALPGRRLRPRRKGRQGLARARRQGARGGGGFTVPAARAVEGNAAAGLGTDLLLANELADATRLGRLPALARVTLAVDSDATI